MRCATRWFLRNRRDGRQLCIAVLNTVRRRIGVGATARSGRCDIGRLRWLHVVVRSRLRFITRCRSSGGRRKRRREAVNAWLRMRVLRYLGTIFLGWLRTAVLLLRAGDIPGDERRPVFIREELRLGNTEGVGGLRQFFGKIDVAGSERFASGCQIFLCLLLRGGGWSSDATGCRAGGSVPWRH